MLNGLGRGEDVREWDSRSWSRDGLMTLQLHQHIGSKQTPPVFINHDGVLNSQTSITSIKPDPIILRRICQLHLKFRANSLCALDHITFF